MNPRRFHGPLLALSVILLVLDGSTARADDPRAADSCSQGAQLVKDLQYDKAIALLGDAIRLAPQSADAHFERGGRSRLLRGRGGLLDLHGHGDAALWC